MTIPTTTEDGVIFHLCHAFVRLNHDLQNLGFMPVRAIVMGSNHDAERIAELRPSFMHEQVKPAFPGDLKHYATICGVEVRTL